MRRDPGDHTATWTSTTGHRYSVAHHDHRSSATLARAPSAPDDAELRWSDEILTDYDWDNIDWNDSEYQPACAVRYPAAVTNAAIQTDVKAPPSDDQCPF